MSIATTLLSSKLHGSDKRWRHGRQQIKNFENCRCENICIKLCFNFNKEVFSDGYITKWNAITMPVHNHICTSCEISKIVHYYDLLLER